MEKTKLTIRVDREALELAKRYAADHNTSLSRLVSEFLKSLRRKEAARERLPVLHRLSGVLPPEASVEEYKAHLESKHGV
jgi:hypothetical protein